jgi:hypothetical protein
MTALAASSDSLTRPVSCVACMTHARPQDVPWQQHALGCPLRVAALATTAP